MNTTTTAPTETTDRFGAISIRLHNRYATIRCDEGTFHAATFFDYGEWGQGYVDSRQYKTERGARKFAHAFVDAAKAAK